MEYVPLPVQKPFLDDVRLMLRAVLHDFRTGDSRAPSVEDHLQTLIVAAAIETSAEQGMRVHVPSFAVTFGIPILSNVTTHARIEARHPQSLCRPVGTRSP